MLVDGVLTAISNNAAALALTASTTNYVEATRAGVVSKNTTAFTPGSIPLYTIVTGASTVTSYTDWRAWVQPKDAVSIAVGVVVTTADVTLSESQARCSYLPVTGALTNNRNVIVPNYWSAAVYCGNTGEQPGLASWWRRPSAPSCSLTVPTS
jgi:hypothetical protein